MNAHDTTLFRDSGIFWTEPRVALLRKLSGTMSARVIGEMLGATRNAVIGKAYRLRLHCQEPGGSKYDHNIILDRWAAGESSVVISAATGATDGTIRNIIRRARAKHDPRAIARPRVRQRTTAARTRSGLRPARVDLSAPKSHSIPLIALKANECHYPDGAPTERAVTFCGLGVFARGDRTSPYCEYHHGLCYRPIDERAARRGNFVVRRVAMEAAT